MDFIIDLNIVTQRFYAREVPSNTHLFYGVYPIRHYATKEICEKQIFNYPR